MGQAYLHRSFFPRLLREACGPLRIVIVCFLPGAREAQDLGEGRFVMPLGRVAGSSWEEDDDEALDLGATVCAMTDALCRRLGVDPYRRRVRLGERRVHLRDAYPLVLARSRLKTARRVLAATGMDAELRAQATRQLRDRRSLFVPRPNVILLGRTQGVDAAEEVAHFLNFALRGDLRCDPSGSFYQAVWDEAVGFLGSRLLVPARPGIDIDEADTPLAKFLQQHRSMERSFESMEAVPGTVGAVLSSSGSRRSRAFHALGYRLGDGMADAAARGDLPPASLRRIFEAPSLRERGALRRYLRWAKRLWGR